MGLVYSGIIVNLIKIYNHKTRALLLPKDAELAIHQVAPTLKVAIKLDEINQNAGCKSNPPCETDRPTQADFETVSKRTGRDNNKKITQIQIH